ncbi:MAG: thermolysin metallopeptidase family [bacterium P3]|nr:MAG: thermolysin metallopeptidase family [bacterium P3]KWW41494.1 MAG: thermolysin metallopeptidase family [bacterium F083]
MLSRSMRRCAAIAALLLAVLPARGLPDTVYTKDGVALPLQPPHKNIRPVYRSHAWRDASLPCAAAPVLWVVTRPWFESVLQPFVQWKQQTGHRVEIFYVDTSDCDSIHALLQRRYDSATALQPGPDYVLIAGNAALVAPFAGRHRPASELTDYVTDLYYGEFTGDWYPEAAVGRLPAADTAELRLMLDKTLAYERMAMPDLSYLSRVLLVAGKENTPPAPTATNGQVNYLGRTIKTLRPETDTLCYRNPGSEQQLDEIVGQVRHGAGLVSYTAHGTVHGWHYPDFTYRIADTLGDSTAAVYINNCCYANHLAAESMGVHLMRKGRGGAVAVVGATNSTLWEEDYLWNIGARLTLSIEPQYDEERPGALDRLLRQGGLSPRQRAATMGDLLHAGNFAVSEAGSIFEAYYWEIYNLLGDPTLMPCVGQPDSLYVEAAAPPERGAAAIELRGTPYAYAAVSDSGGLLGSGWIDSNGRASVALCRALTTETVFLAASAAAGIPYVNRVTTQTPRLPRMAVGSYAAVGDSLHITLLNVSDDTCFGHRLTLVQQTEDSIGALLAPTAPAVMDTVAPQATREAVLPLTVATGRTPLIRMQIELSDDTGCYARLQAALEGPAATPRLLALLPLQNGTACLRPGYGGHYTLAAVVENPSGDTAGCTLAGHTYAVPPGVTDTLLAAMAAGDGERHLCVDIVLRCGTWRQDTTCCITLNGDIEDFESGDLSAYPWDNNSSLQPWRIDSEVCYSGTYSLRSGAVGHRQTSDLALTLTLPYDDTLTFWRRTSTEEGYDELLFYIDNQLYEGWSGQTGWGRVRYVLPQGRHRLLWRYRKDESGSQGADCVWIDRIQMPLSVWDAPYGYAGAAGIDTAAGGRLRPTLHPNPAHGGFILSGTPPDGTWSGTLYDIWGRPLRQLTAGFNDTGTLTKGIYLVVIRTDRRTATLKLTVQ